MRSEKLQPGMMNALLLLCLLVIFGCSQKRNQEKMTEEILEHATGKDVDVNIQDGNVQITDKDSRTEIAETKSWPADLSDDVPEFNTGKIQRVVKTQEQADTWTVNIYLADISIDDIRSYEIALKKKGWQTNLTQMGDKGGFLNGQKGTMGINFMFNQEQKNGMLGVFNRP
jgi:Zn/Cd-binding protein ZinT